MKPARRHNEHVEWFQDAINRALDGLMVPGEEGRKVLELARVKVQNALDALKLPECKD